MVEKLHEIKNTNDSQKADDIKDFFKEFSSIVASGSQLLDNYLTINEISSISKVTNRQKIVDLKLKIIRFSDCEIECGLWWIQKCHISNTGTSVGRNNSYTNSDFDYHFFNKMGLELLEHDGKNHKWKYQTHIQPCNNSKMWELYSKDCAISHRLGVKRFTKFKSGNDFS